MKKIKIFPAPHVEVRVHVSEQMEKDMRECQELAQRCGVVDCDSCSWDDVVIDENTPLCTFQAVIDKVLGKGE